MTQRCLNCLKYTLCAFNFLCWLCGSFVLGFGIYLMMSSKFSTLVPSLPSINIANTLVITGTIVTCVSFLGFLGALKENRCLLISFFILLFLLMLVELAMAILLLVFEKDIDSFFKDDLKKSLETYKKDINSSKNITAKHDWDTIQSLFKCCGVEGRQDWTEVRVPQSCCVDSCKNSTELYWEKGCYTLLKEWFETNFLTVGVAVIILCIIEVLGMCFSMTLFCHIRQSGGGYK
ncbi:leukocyte surface antigen CD53 [Lepisosteus oculatus]|uniref:Tetraspanin n=1 Tax=Lepisosteus oculatus TaxID=7918 RepID=W5N477_LEPOC|nr:PREDICTED: leukocyte surface antigen CD53-like [Lepisosteus oculatus]